MSWSSALVVALAAAPPAIRFEDVTAVSGLAFRHTSGASPEKYMPETMGAGVCLLDADQDGLLDVYLVDGGTIGPAGPRPGPPDRLFRNRSTPGKLRFEDWTARSGLGDPGYGMGCAVGDADNDGDPDLYVTNYSGNTLWINDGRGRFTEVGETAGVGCGRWSASATFGDLDLDGRLDLYVANYVDFSPKDNKYCGDLGRGIRAYCHPDVYDGVPPALYVNQGGLKFKDATREAGLELTAGKGLGVVLSDVDLDGRADIYGANDSTINYLFLNQGGGKFKDVSLVSGAGYDANGRAQAGMGVDAGDVDGDGDMDLFVTNLDLETNTLYVNAGKGRFRDLTPEAGLALPGLILVGFGTSFADLDNDGDLDILIVNGHILDTIEKTKDNQTHAQTPQVFANDGEGRFTDVAAAAGPFFARRMVGRGLAAGDLDDDGDLDFVTTANGGEARVVENRSAGGRSLLVRLRGKASNRDGFGALLTLEVAGRRLVRECRGASSYLSQGDPRVHFGLGQAAKAERLTVRWPSGRVDTAADLAAGTEILVEEGKGATQRRTLRAAPVAP